MHSKPMLLSLRTNYLSFMPLLTGLAGYLEERGMRTIVCITSFAADRGAAIFTDLQKRVYPASRMDCGACYHRMDYAC